MIKKTGAAALAVILGMILLVGWFSREPVDAQDKFVVAPQKWEYKIVLPDSIEDPRANQVQFDKLGTEGWELCVAHSSTRPNYYIFKRPLR